MLPLSRVRDFDPIYRPREGAAAPRDARVQRTDVTPRAGAQFAAAAARSVVCSASLFSTLQGVHAGLLDCSVHLDLVVAQQSNSPFISFHFSFVFPLFYFFPIRK